MCYLCSHCVCVVDHLLPQVVHALKSLEVLRVRLSVVSPNTVDLFRALPQSQLREFGFFVELGFSLEFRLMVCYPHLWIQTNGGLFTHMSPSQWSTVIAHIFGCGYCKYRMDCSAILDLSRICPFLFVFCPL